jgi:hypothetical protein
MRLFDLNSAWLAGEMKNGVLVFKGVKTVRESLKIILLISKDLL